MKIELLLRKLEVKYTDHIKKIQIRIKLGDLIEFYSSQQTSTNNIYPFLQKNTLEITTQTVDYICIELLSHEKLIAHKTLFIKDAVKNTKMQLNQAEHQGNSYVLSYELNADESKTQSNKKSNFLKSKKSIQDEPDHLSTEQGKLEILKMGVLMYNFANRLDPTIKMSKNLVSLFSWENPTYTIIFGVLMTFLIAYPKLSVAIFSLFLVFGRNFIINKAATTELWQDPSKRLLLPPQNVIFLQDNMQGYCDLFEIVNKFLRSQDKSTIITMVHITCKLGALVLILSIFFSLETLMIIGLWIGLLVLSPARKSLLKNLKPRIVEINNYLDSWLKKFGNIQVVFKILQNTEGQIIQIIKEFYIYEHQRWWVGRQWVATHWSNEDRELQLLARKQAPKGWKWIQDWQIEYSQGTDYQGYEYSHDLLKEYNSSKSLKTLRRRKWTRKCSRKISKLKSAQN